MSLTFIHDFQKQLYSALSADAWITNNINKIYFGVVQDGQSPFILINIQKAEDLSLHHNSIYSVDFQIIGYAKDHNHQLLVSLGDRVVELLSNSERCFGGYIIAGIKANDVQFERARDLVLNKLTINYKALIKKEVYDELS
ncbi:MAG: hypothetical protein COA94_06840 [Rickettsiales bacterium]|nr:MAG: hypothetical protein COA94_06840 [Rickettsiales bacterium]